MSRRDRDDEDLEPLLSELASTLDALRDELHREDRERSGERGRRDGDVRRRRRGGRRYRDPRGRSDLPRPPRPPSPGDLLRFTNDYTIPTVIATLEATIEALELLRRFLQLAGGSPPDGRVSDRSGGSRLADELADGLSGAGTRAASDATDALSTLRRALSEADLPEEGESRDLVDEIRDLSAELDRRIAESRETVDRERDRERREDRERSGEADDGAVVIDVTDGDEESGSDDGEDAAADDDDAPEVDVDAELDSIKRELGTDDPATNGDDRVEADDAGDDGADAGSASDADGDPDADRTDT